MIIPCTNWRPCGICNGGCCAIGAHARPTFGICLTLCTQYDGPARGLGDMIHNVIKTAAFGNLKPCNGCKKRRINQNAKHPSRQTQELLAGVGS